MLYKDLAIVHSRGWSNVSWLENFLDPKAGGLLYTAGVSISMKPDVVGYTPLEGDFCSDGLVMNPAGGDTGWQDTKDLLGQMQYQSRLLNSLIRCIVKKIPRNRLRRFRYIYISQAFVHLTNPCCSWQHPTMLSGLTIDLLARYHRRSIDYLQVHNAGEDCAFRALALPGLSTLHISDISDNAEPGWAALILYFNCTSLVDLKLGCERAIALAETGRNAQWSLSNRTWISTHLHLQIELIAGILENDQYQAAEARKLAERGLVLQSLHLIAVNFGALVALKILPPLDVTNLQTLSLESCHGHGSAFALPATVANENASWAPRLKRFTFRHECPDEALQEQ